MIKEISEDDWDYVIDSDLYESLEWAMKTNREDDYMYNYIHKLTDYLKAREAGGN